jgi:hypothetical protein
MSKHSILKSLALHTPGFFDCSALEGILCGSALSRYTMKRVRSFNEDASAQMSMAAMSMAETGDHPLTS